MNIKISVVMTVLNEERRIRDCLESVKWADEIIVVDNSSTDKTVEIATQYTKNIFQKSNDPLSIDVQKNFGIQKATGEWILILDADEVVTKELAEEIKQIINLQTEAKEKMLNGFWIPRKNIIFGKWIEHTGWYPDNQLRLFRKGKGQFEKNNVHQPLGVVGDTGVLLQPMLHYNYDSVSQFIHKLDVYTTVTAQDRARKKEKFVWKELIELPFEEFLSRYFARKGYKDGLHGLVLSLLMGFYEFITCIKVWELKGFQEVHSEEVIKDFETSIHKSAKQLHFWSYDKKIGEETTSIKKHFHKIRRKLNM